MICNILAVAGSDPSGGAGVQADLKTISANGGYAMAALTALTAQNTCGVQAVMAVPPEMVRAQIASLRADIAIHAVKIGMLGDRALIAAVAEALSGLDVPRVLDPVMVAKGGDRLLALDAVAGLRAALPELLGPRGLLTPNLPEAADLLQTREARTRDEMRAQAEALRALGAASVYLKGGHLDGPQSPDLLLTAEGATWFDGARIATRNTHGTGCTLSSALACHGAHLAWAEAAPKARAYLRAALNAADGLAVGQGIGPLDHFYNSRG